MWKNIGTLKLSKTKMLIKALIVSVFMAGNPWFTQNNSTLKDRDLVWLHSKEELVLEREKSLCGNDDLRKDCSSMVANVWEKEALLQINRLFVDELNAIRMKCGLDSIVGDIDLQHAAQKQAVVLHNLWYTTHMTKEYPLYKRLEDSNIKSHYWVENLWQGQESVWKIVYHRYTYSLGHKEALLDNNITKVALWYKDWFRVYYAIK